MDEYLVLRVLLAERWSRVMNRTGDGGGVQCREEGFDWFKMLTGSHFPPGKLELTFSVFRVCVNIYVLLEIKILTYLTSPPCILIPPGRSCKSIPDSNFPLD
jgi:hypothetical protein